MVYDFHKWMNEQEAGYFISIMGNHELLVEKNFYLAKDSAEKACPGVHFIEEGLVELEGLKIWCSAYTPWFLDWAYNVPRDEIHRHWDLIPDGIDVLATHGPAAGILDQCKHGDRVGCGELLKAIDRVKPRIHLFGHIHEEYGKVSRNGTDHYNCSNCNEDYRPVNPVTVIELG